MIFKLCAYLFETCKIVVYHQYLFDHSTTQGHKFRQFHRSLVYPVPGKMASKHCCRAAIPNSKSMIQFEVDFTPLANTIKRHILS
jgi:hypothetical protein